MVSPRKSRRKSACFSRTRTYTPAWARSMPSIIPAGPPPAMQHECRSLTPRLSLNDRLARVHHQRGPGDVGRLVAGQEEDGKGDLAGLSPAAEEIVPRALCAQVGLGHAFRCGGADVKRRD